MKAPPFNVANTITISRVVLAVVVLLFLVGGAGAPVPDDRTLWTVFF